jgi:hypothetical protein
MTRNWFAMKSRSLRMDQNGTRRPRRRPLGVSLESLEARLSLSSVPAVTPRSWDLNPQPLPPGFMAEVGAMPVPGIVGQHIGSAMIQGNHIGMNIVGNHIGTNIVGQHIGTSVIQGQHIGS